MKQETDRNQHSIYINLFLRKRGQLNLFRFDSFHFIEQKHLEQ